VLRFSKLGGFGPAEAGRQFIMQFRHVARSSALGALSTALLAATAALPAQAAQSFSLDTPQRSINDGSTHGTGSITFVNRYEFKISSTVWDSCPPDGDGAYLTLNVEFMDGSGYGYPAADAFNRDSNGCDNGRISNTVTRSFAKRVKRVQIVLREADNGITSEDDHSTWKDNPYTG
jgi:hypothetical protein